MMASHSIKCRSINVCCWGSLFALARLTHSRSLVDKLVTGTATIASIVNSMLDTPFMLVMMLFGTNSLVNCAVLR